MSLIYYPEQARLALTFVLSPKKMVFRQVNWVSHMVHSFSLSSLTPLRTVHIFCLLATHHILREVSPGVFTLNRISSLMDSGKSFAEPKQYQAESRGKVGFFHCCPFMIPYLLRPKMKYRDTNGIAAFVGLWFVSFIMLFHE